MEILIVILLALIAFAVAGDLIVALLILAVGLVVVVALAGGSIFIVTSIIESLEPHKKIIGWAIFGLVLYVAAQHFWLLFSRWKRGDSKRKPFPWALWTLSLVGSGCIGALEGGVLGAFIAMSLLGGLIWLDWVEKNFAPCEKETK